MSSAVHQIQVSGSEILFNMNVFDERNDIKLLVDDHCNAVYYQYSQYVSG